MPTVKKKHLCLSKMQINLTLVFKHSNEIKTLVPSFTIHSPLHSTIPNDTIGLFLYLQNGYNIVACLHRKAFL